MERRKTKMSRQLVQAMRFAETRIAGVRTGRTLPGVAALAAECGVAYVTMWKALDHARRRGLVDARPRRGIVVLRRPSGEPGGSLPEPADPCGEPQATVTGGRRFERTAVALRRDLLAGCFAPGAALPSVKELSDRYGVCAVTLSKALRQLTVEGTLSQRGARYHPTPAPAPRRQHGTVLLVAAGDQDRNLTMAHARTPEYMRHLEHACSLRNVSLAFASYDTRARTFHDRGLVHRLRTDQALRDSVIGVMIWQAGIDRQDWTELVRQLAPLGQPMALLDEAGEYQVPHITGAGRRIRLYSLAVSAEAGRRMGRYLLALGHRCVAYVSPVHRSAWSRNRLEGLREAFANAGVTEPIRQFVLNEFGLPVEFLEQSAGVRDNLVQALDRTAPAFQGDPLSAGTLRALRTSVAPVLARQAYALAMRPLMEAARADRTVTAWVAADDDTALPCLDFLSASGTHVPQDISVVGFDDSFESSARKLTSYNYNGPAYMRAMLAHVLSPGCPESGGRGLGTVDIGGTVVERRTSGPVGKR